MKKQNYGATDPWGVEVRTIENAIKVLIIWAIGNFGDLWLKLKRLLEEQLIARGPFSQGLIIPKNALIGKEVNFQQFFSKYF